MRSMNIILSLVAVAAALPRPQSQPGGDSKPEGGAHIQPYPYPQTHQPKGEAHFLPYPLPQTQPPKLSKGQGHIQPYPFPQIQSPKGEADISPAPVQPQQSQKDAHIPPIGALHRKPDFGRIQPVA